MPGSTAAIPEMSDAPLPAFREPRDQPLRGRLPNPGRLHRRDPESGGWVEDDLAQAEDVADVDGLEADDELAAEERDAKAQVRQLRDERAQLILLALTDAKARSELEDVESRLRHAEQRLERVPLAREELARRAAEAAAEEERQRREGHLTVAAKLEQKRAAAARKIDEGAQLFAQAIAEYGAIVGPLEQELRAGGDRDPTRVRPAPWAFMAALKAACGACGVERGFDLPPQTPAAPFAG